MTSVAPLANANVSAAQHRVGYIMTHYPRTAQTFISGEIDAVERAGVVVDCVAMNTPDAAELTPPGAAERHARTLYLKQSPLAAIGAVLRFGLRHPVGMASVAGAAIDSAGGSPSRIVRRLAHYAQAARVARVVLDREIRHLHAHFGLAPATIAWLASRIASLHGRPVGFSFTIHGFHDFVDPDEARLDLKARHAAAIVCISDYTRSQLCRLTPADLWPKFRVLRCGVDLDALAFSPRPARSGPPTIIAIGRLSAEKGFALLIEALVQLRRVNIEAQLRLIGDGPEHGALMRAVHEAGLDDHVIFTGELSPEAVRAELRAADIFCLPSFNEGLPVSIMEAMAAGVPVVTTWIAGIPELAENNVTALTVPPARTDALAAALRQLCDDPALGRTLAAEARKRIEAMHNQTRNGKQMAELLREIAS